MICDGQTDRQMNGQTDNYGKNNITPPHTQIKCKWSYDTISLHMVLYICTKVHKNISMGFRVIERT